MAVRELGSIAEVEGWGGEQSRLNRIFSGIKAFARKKPLGAVCGAVVIFFFIIGDVVPETVNAAGDAAGLGRPPPPQGSSLNPLLGTDNIGRDTLSRLMYAARTAVMVSFGAVFISQAIGSTIGIARGHYGGSFRKDLHPHL